MSFLRKSQPYTPPFPLYLVPETRSNPPSRCFSINCGINLGWWERSASIIKTKFPVACLIPWM
uniref:Uncharacterized protein n=1 Tax=Anguilla anguilla TaxID=7936 RepID=A0A0E9XG64_ANGAN